MSNESIPRPGDAVTEDRELRDELAELLGRIELRPAPLADGRNIIVAEDMADALMPTVAAALARARAEALREAADAIQALHPGEVKASVVFLRARAALDVPAPTPAEVCRHEEKSDPEGSWDVCVPHDSLIPCDVGAAADRVIDAIEDVFLAHLPSAALALCAQEDINAALDAMRERFETPQHRTGERL